MPEVLDAPAAAPAAAPNAAPAPAPESAPSSDIGGAPGSGIDGMMAALDRSVAAATKAAGKPKEAPVAAAPVAQAKPVEAAKPVVAKPADAPAAAEGTEPDWSKAPPKWHKIYEDHKGKTAKTIQSLESKIKSLETKPFEQPGDARKLEALEKQLEEIRGESTKYKSELVKRDYRESDDYKRNFVERATAIYTEAVNYVSQLQVTDGENSRPATKQDFDKLRLMPAAMRSRAAREMFGDDAHDVIQFTRDIDSLSRDADAAVRRHSEEYDKSRQDQDMASRKMQQEYDAHYESALEGIREHPEYGKWFKEDEGDPEASEVLKEGFANVNDITSKFASRAYAPEEEAAHAAVLRSQAAAFPRVVLEVTRLTNENAALKEELGKYRGTDPGNANRTGEAPAPKEPVGIAGAAALYDNMPRD